MTTEQRLEQLEKRVRRLGALAIALVTIVVGGFVLGQVKPQKLPGVAQAKAPTSVSDVIRAKRFEVVNDMGMPVVTLRSWKLGGWIEARDAAGMVGLFGVASDDRGNGVIVTRSSKGHDLVHIGSTKGDQGAITTHSGKGYGLVRIGATPGHDGVITIHESKGHAIVSIGTTGGHEGAIRTHSSKGHDLVQIGATKDDEGAITTRSSKGHALVSIGTTGGGGAISVRNKTGEEVIRACADEYGMGYLGVFDRHGKGHVIHPR